MKEIKSIKTYWSEIDLDQEINKHLSSFEKYNKVGQMIYLENKDELGETTRVEKHSYESNQISEIFVQDLVDKYGQKTEFKYKEDQIIEQIEHFDNGTKLIRRSNYDANNRLWEILETNEKGSFIGKETYDYQEKIEYQRKYDENNNLYEELKITYDNENREIEYLIEEFEFGTTTKNISKSITTREYTGGILIKSYTEELGRIIYSEYYDYDSKNNRISTIIKDKEFDFEGRVQYKYDVNDQLVTEENFQDSILMQSDTYKYDLEGHVVEVIYTEYIDEDHIQCEKMERIIEYWKI